MSRRCAAVSTSVRGFTRRPCRLDVGLGTRASTGEDKEEEPDFLSHISHSSHSSRMAAGRRTEGREEGREANDSEEGFLERAGIPKLPHGGPTSTKPAGRGLEFEAGSGPPSRFDAVQRLVERLSDVRQHPWLHLALASLAAAEAWVGLLIVLTALVGWPALLLVGLGMPLTGIVLQNRATLWRALYLGPPGAVFAGLILDTAEPFLRSPGLRPVMDPILTGGVWLVAGASVLWAALWPTALLLRALRKASNGRSRLCGRRDPAAPDDAGSG